MKGAIIYNFQERQVDMARPKSKSMSDQIPNIKSFTAADLLNDSLWEKESKARTTVTINPHNKTLADTHGVNLSQLLDRALYLVLETIPNANPRKP